MKKLMISACFLLTLAGCSDSERAQYVDEGKPGAALAIANSMLNTQVTYTDRAQSLLDDLEGYGLTLCSYKYTSSSGKTSTRTGFEFDGVCPATIDSVTVDVVEITQLLTDYGNNYYCLEGESKYEKVNSAGSSYKLQWTQHAPKNFLKSGYFSCDK